MTKPSKKHSIVSERSEELKRLREENQYLKAELAFLKKLDALIQDKEHTRRRK